MQDLNEKSLGKNNSRLGKLEAGILGVGSAALAFGITGTLNWHSIIGVDLRVIQEDYFVPTIPLIMTGIDYGIQKLKHNPSKILSKKYLKSFGISAVCTFGGYVGGKYLNSLVNFSPF